MKILNLEQFLQLPTQTLFFKYTPQIIDDLGVFLGRCGEIDFVYDDMSWIKCSGSKERWEILDKAEKEGFEFKMDYEFSGRDGLYEDKQLFVVFDKSDVQELIKRLEKCL